MESLFRDVTSGQRDLAAIIICFAAVFSFLGATRLLAHYGVFSTFTARKWLHINIGVIFISCCTLFSSSPYAKYIAVAFPASITLNFCLIGLGVIKDEKTVRTMSRSGAPKELLFGPVSYGIVICLATVLYWRTSPVGIIAEILLCAGDGYAGFLGTRYGRERLPWNKSKTIVGSLAFVIFSIAYGSFFVQLFHQLGLFNFTLLQFFPTLIITTLVGALVESFPGQSDWDNFTVFAAALLTMHTLGW